MATMVHMIIYSSIDNFKGQVTSFFAFYEIPQGRILSISPTMGLSGSGG